MAYLVASMALAGCGPQVGAPRDPGTGGAEAGSFADLEQRIFVPRCATAACHGGSPARVFPGLDAGVGHAALVGVASEQLPSMSLVEPGDPENSYLVAKLRGPGGAVGGSGTRMPPADAPLDDTEMQEIEQWIANGAPND